MGRLIHLNGPTGSGKTTLGRRWVEARRGALLVDPDSLLATLPDWRSRFWELVPVARTMAIDVAGPHLAAGGDVVVSQLTTSTAEVAPYEELCRSHAAAYVEVLFRCDADLVVARFRGRHRTAGSGAGLRDHLDQVVEDGGGECLLRRVVGDHDAWCATRPHALDLRVRDEPEDESLRRLEALLG